MENKLAFDEVELNYILEALRSMRIQLEASLDESAGIIKEVSSHYTTTCRQIEDRIYKFLDGEE